MAQQCCGDGGGGIAANGAQPSASAAAAIASGEDRLSAFPDDVLITILVGLGSTAEAVRTSVLSRRWRRVWTLLPELRFHLVPDGGRRIREVLVAPDAPPPPLRGISVTAQDPGPDSLQAWLPDAARRLSGNLFYRNMAPPRMEGEDGAEAIELPCFEDATGIELTLGFLGLALPFAGTFTRLAKLDLYRVRLHGPCELGDVVSSSRCPNLKSLRVHEARGVDKLSIHSVSLLEVDLDHLNGLRQLTVVAPALKELKLSWCFAANRPVAVISTPQLVLLDWKDRYDRCSVQLGNLGQLLRLRTDFFVVHGPHNFWQNLGMMELLQQFQFIHGLDIILGYPPRNIGNLPYLMEEMAVLPRTDFLTISLLNGGHAFGPSLFHVLKLCTGTRRLSLVLFNSKGLESVCQSGCNCDQPTNWKAEELLLNHLKLVDIINLAGAEHEVVFLKRLFSWATVLEKMRITFDFSVSKSKARELLPLLSSFSRPETRVEFYMYHDADESSVFLLDPEDQGTAF